MSLLKELQDLVKKHENTEELFTFSEVKSIVENTLLSIDASDFDVNEMELSFDIDYDNRISAEITDASIFIDEILGEIQDGIEKSLIYCAKQRK